VLNWGRSVWTGLRSIADASKRNGGSYQRLLELETQLRREVEELLR